MEKNNTLVISANYKDPMKKLLSKILIPVAVVVILFYGYLQENLRTLQHFTPEPGSAFKLTFEYPQDWIWFRENNELARFGYNPASIYFYNLSEEGCINYISTVQGSDAIAVNKEVSCTKIEATIHLSVEIINPPIDWAEMRMEFVLNPIEDDKYGLKTLADDVIIEIDGIPVRMVSYLTNDLLEKSQVIYYVAYLQYGDRGYQFMIKNLKQDDINGDFYREFLGILESIKLLP